ADVAHGVDGVLEVFAEFRTQATNMHVNGAGAAEVVVSPYGQQDLIAGEDPFGVHGEELQQRELAIGQIEAAPAEVGGERGLVDAQGAGDDDHRLALGIPRPAVAAADTGRTGSRQAACRARDTPRLGAEARAEATARAGAARLGGEMAVTGHAQPGLHLGGAGGGEEEIGDAPLRRGGRQPTLAEHDDDGGGDACGTERLGDARGEGMIEAGGGADVQNPHVLHPPPRRPTSESEYSEVRVVRALSAAGSKSRMRDQMRHDSAVIRWIRVAVALVLVLALSASVYW